MNPFIVLLTLLPFLVNAQNDIWWLGNDVGIHFVDGKEPELISGLSGSNYQTVVVSDSEGKLLFYTDGVKVRDKTQNVMPNGSGLLGRALLQSQSVLVLPFIEDDQKYYIFTVGFEEISQGDLHYSVVDMSLNGGLGDIQISNKNIKLATNLTQRVSAIRSLCGGLWVVIKERNSKRFFSFLINDSGIKSSPVISEVNTKFLPNNQYGWIKPSANDSLLLMTGHNFLELYKFNREFGTLSDAVNLYFSESVDSSSPVFATFSPNSKRLFSSSKEFFRYDLTDYNQSGILNSRVNLAPGRERVGRYMQLAPDGNIYFVLGDSCVQQIKDPDNRAEVSEICLFQASSSYYTTGLQNLVVDPVFDSPLPPTIFMTDTTSICQDSPLIIDLSTYSSAKFLWDDGSTTPTHFIKSSGTYTVEARYDQCALFDSTVVMVSECFDPSTQNSVFIPNVFSPNGDSRNDELIIYFAQDPIYYKLIVFDRWGNLVFKSSNLFNRWQGMYKNKSVPIGTYIAIVEYQTNPNTSIVREARSIDVIK